MADGRYRLGLLEKAPGEIDRILIHPQVVWVCYPARQYQRVVVVCADIGGYLVHLERVGFVEVVESLDLTGLSGYQLDFCPGASL